MNVKCRILLAAVAIYFLWVGGLIAMAYYSSSPSRPSGSSGQCLRPPRTKPKIPATGESDGHITTSRNRLGTRARCSHQAYGLYFGERHTACARYASSSRDIPLGRSKHATRLRSWRTNSRLEHEMEFTGVNSISFAQARQPHSMPGGLRCRPMRFST